MKKKMISKCGKMRVVLVLTVLSLVLTGAGVSLSKARVASKEQMLSADAPELLFLHRQNDIKSLSSRWNPSAVMDEVREVVLTDRLCRVFAKFPRRIALAEREKLAQMLVDEGKRVDIDPLLLAAVIRVESAFFTGAVSDKGARGLMQVMPTTGEEVARKLGLDWQGPDQLHDVETNVRLGVYYLDWLLDLYAGNYKYALTAYNRGPTNVRHIVRRYGGLTPQFTEYFQKIQQTYQGYL